MNILYLLDHFQIYPNVKLKYYKHSHIIDQTFMKLVIKTCFNHVNLNSDYTCLGPF